MHWDPIPKMISYLFGFCQTDHLFPSKIYNHHPIESSRALSIMSSIRFPRVPSGSLLSVVCVLANNLDRDGAWLPGGGGIVSHCRLSSHRSQTRVYRPFPEMVRVPKISADSACCHAQIRYGGLLAVPLSERTCLWNEVSRAAPRHSSTCDPPLCSTMLLRDILRQSGEVSNEPTFNDSL